MARDRYTVKWKCF